MKKLWEWIRHNLGPVFVIQQAIMHVYLAVYLTFNWTNIAIWAFTVYEMVMFIYLLVTKKKGGVLR